MQSGHIRVNGRWWILKVREWVTVDGIKKRKDSYKKLARLEEHRPNPDGSAPNSVRALADLELAPINAGQREGLSADSLKSYIERFLQSGIGRTGRKLEANTILSYRRDYAAIKDLIPDIQMRQIRTPDINRLFLALIEQDGDDMRATSGYRNIRNFLSGVFRQAVGEGAIDFNPVREAMVLSGKDSDTHAYTLEETYNLCETVSDHTARAAFMVLAFTGLRKGEMKGLRWEDYDAKAGVLNVRRAVAQGKLKETKTKASKAPVPVIGIVRKALDDHLKKNSGDGLIFHPKDESQTVINFEHLIFDVVRPELKEAGIEWHGIHAFRRGLDTAMKDLGIDLSTRTNIMRHVPRNVTDKYYGQASFTQMRKALEKVEARYKAVVKKAEKRR
jgi:integrase